METKTLNVHFIWMGNPLPVECDYKKDDKLHCLNNILNIHNDFNDFINFCKEKYEIDIKFKLVIWTDNGSNSYNFKTFFQQNNIIDYEINKIPTFITEGNDYTDNDVFWLGLYNKFKNDSNVELCRNFFTNLKEYTDLSITAKYVIISDIIRMWIVCNYELELNVTNIYFDTDQYNIKNLLYSDITNNHTKLLDKLLTDYNSEYKENTENKVIVCPDCFPFKIYNGFRLATEAKHSKEAEGIVMNNDIIFANPKDEKTQKICDYYFTNIKCNDLLKWSIDMVVEIMDNSGFGMVTKSIHKYDDDVDIDTDLKYIDVHQSHIQYFERDEVINTARGQYAGYYGFDRKSNYKFNKYKYKIEQLYNKLGLN